MTTDNKTTGRKSKVQPQRARRQKHTGDKDSVLFIRTLSRDVKNGFKTWCDLHGIYMYEAIEAVMREVATNPNFIPQRMIDSMKSSA